MKHCTTAIYSIIYIIIYVIYVMLYVTVYNTLPPKGHRCLFIWSCDFGLKLVSLPLVWSRLASPSVNRWFDCQTLRVPAGDRIQWHFQSSWCASKRSEHVESAHRLGARGAACFHCSSGFSYKSQRKTWQAMHKVCARWVNTCTTASAVLLFVIGVRRLWQLGEDAELLIWKSRMLSDPASRMMVDSSGGGCSWQQLNHLEY